MTKIPGFSNKFSNGTQVAIIELSNVLNFICQQHL